MTRKDFALVAETLCELTRNDNVNEMTAIITALASRFAQNYPNFNVDKFLAAAGVKL